MSAFYPVLSPSEKDPRRIASVVNSLRDGKVNSTGSVTLTASTTTTTVSDGRAAVTSAVLMMPTTANAAAEAWHIAAGDGSFVVTHSSATSTDRTYRYVVFG